VRVLEDPESLDCLTCAADVLERARTLMDQEGAKDPLCFAKAWIRFGTLEPFKYRAELNAFAGKDWTAPDWKSNFGQRKLYYERHGKNWNAVERRRNGLRELDGTEWMTGSGCALR
jgi:hypothetical protein